MISIVVVLAVLLQFSIGQCFCLRWWSAASVRHLSNETARTSKTTTSFNETTLANFTYTRVESSSESLGDLQSRGRSAATTPQQVDCLGLGNTIATTLEWFLRSQPNGSDALDVRFLLSSRKQPRRVQVVLGEQFGLEWTDFRMGRRTVVIVHGFLSHGEETWITDMERALLEWDDTNVVIIDWSAGGNTWNYYKAAVNTRIVGHQVSKFIEHVTNATISNGGTDASNWGPLHLIGHSLGAHICGFAAKELKSRRNRWTVRRITGLDPAQPCFRNADASVHLHKNDAPFVDVIHTNGKLLTSLGLGLPEAIGHVDFYPNGGKTQPGCVRTDSRFVDYLPIPTTAIRQAICSHGRSYVYFIESLTLATVRNCTFWSHHWDLTYRHFLRLIDEPCDGNVCTEMGIGAELYDQRGTFFVATSDIRPFCANNTDVVDEVKRQMREDHVDDIDD